jgi:hypothetical protein
MSYDVTRYGVTKESTSYECRNCTGTDWDSGLNPSVSGSSAYDRNSRLLSDMQTFSIFTADRTNTRIGVVGNNDYSDFIASVGSSCLVKVGVVDIISVVGGAQCSSIGGLSCGQTTSTSTSTNSTSSSDDVLVAGLSLNNVIIIACVAGGLILIAFFICCCCSSSSKIAPLTRV